MQLPEKAEFCLTDLEVPEAALALKDMGLVGFCLGVGERMFPTEREQILSTLSQ